ncbi:hypothetical protein LCGC14_2544960, partial [marine sediment metagenome]
TKVLVKFETRMAEVSTIAGKTSGSIRRLSQQILDLSRTVPQTADELGAGAYQIFSAGITDTADAMNVLTVASKAAVGGITSTLVSVDAITTILNAYDLGADQAVRVSDLLFQTVKGGKINFDQLSTGIGIVAKQAAVMGVGFDDVAASIAAITKATGRPRAAFTELAGLFRSIIAEEEASQKAAVELEIEWNLAALEARGLTAMLEDLNTATKGNATEIRKVVREDEGFRAAVVLSADGARELGSQLNGMAGSAGVAEAAFKTMAETTENQAKIAINNFNASLLELRDLILPAVTSELKGLVGIMDLFRSVDLRRSAALATVQTLAESLENLTGEARLQAGGVGQRKDLPFAQQQRGPDHVPQLPDIARPGVGTEGFQHFRGQLHDLPPRLPRVLVHEMPDQHGNVLRPVAQRRHRQFHAVDAVVQVLAEVPALHLLGQVPVGGADDANVDADALGAPHPLKVLRLQNAQQLRLKLRARLGDL